MNALSSVVLLLISTRILGGYWGGIFSIAYAVGQQFQPLGAFEMRPIQSTDVEKKYSFATYFASRVLTTLCMLGCILGYALMSGNAGKELLLVVLIASLKLFDAFEDIFHGAFQQNGRLDIAGKAFFFRSLITTACFIIALLVSKDLTTTCIITIIITIVALIWLNIPPAKSLLLPAGTFHAKDLLALLLSCLPLFAGAFLAMYLSNAPKFGLDAFMAKEYQALYSGIFMPALAINLLSSFIFRPLLTPLSLNWLNEEQHTFVRTIIKGAVWAVAASIIVAILAFFLGVPTLNLLFNLDFAPYKTELLILVAGGAFNAISVVIYYGIVVMRLQPLVLIGYGIAALVAFLIGNPIVEHFGMMGAACLYTICMIITVILFAIFFTYGVISNKKKRRD